MHKISHLPQSVIKIPPVDLSSLDLSHSAMDARCDALQGLLKYALAHPSTCCLWVGAIGVIQAKQAYVDLGLDALADDNSEAVAAITDLVAEGGMSDA